MDDDALLNECVKYFKNNPGFKRVFEGMRKKYLSLGAVGGTFLLQRLSHEERQALSGFLRRDYMHNSSATLKFLEFQKALDSTKFNGILMEDVLKGYFKEELISNSQAQALYQHSRSKFFSALLERFDSTPGGLWLQNALSKKEYAYKTLIQRYDLNKQSLLNEISIVCSAINRLPYFQNKKIRLPLFASSIAQDPHALDYNTACGKLFMHALSYHMGTVKPKSASERAELLYKSGIIIDEVSNSVLCSGLMAYSGDGEIHPGWKGFFDRHEPLQATLLNISTILRVIAPSGRVYVVENPSVFSSILDEIHKSNRCACQTISAVCTYGQVNLAGLVLLDLLAASHSEIWYSGDFDPEGLMIANKLKLRYGKALKLWRYSKDDYKAALSNCEANAPRLKQLDSIATPEMLPVVQAVKSKRLCGYQEMILDRILSDIRGS
jgi:uncharacterized protein (TIGR02679 family)